MIVVWNREDADPNGAIFFHCKQAVLKEGLDQLYVRSSKGPCKHTLSINNSSCEYASDAMLTAEDA